jgi:hypothetical protein
MTKKACAYCDKHDALTKEHLWPAALHKRLYTINEQTASSFWLLRIDKDIEGEPQIRDVCGNCNNVVLSNLDSYICSLFDSNFVKILERDEEVVFEHNYHLLKRWLLKISFNSARINGSPDIGALTELRSYMLGRDEGLGRSVQLFIRLSYPEEVPEREINPESSSDNLVRIEPTVHRSGHLYFIEHGVGKKLVRAIHLRSYSFFLAYWPPGNGRAEQDDFNTVFTSRLGGTVLLRPSQPKVKLKCDGIGAWQSISGARNNRLVLNS